LPVVNRAEPTNGTFARRVMMVLGLVTLFMAVAWLIAASPGVPLLLFASVLMAIGLSSMADPLSRRLSIPRSVCVITLALGLVVALFVSLWISGPRLAEQVTLLAERVPAAVEQLRVLLAGMPWGQALLAELDAGKVDMQSLSSLLTGVFRPLASAFGVTLSAIGAAFVCGIMATFIAIEPRAYVSPLLLMVRPERRARVSQILEITGSALQAWLLGRLLSMAVIAVLTFVGLLALGIQEALVLALLAGVLCFIPYVGPVLSAVPAVLATLANGGTDTLWVILLYTGIQIVESNLLTPIIERRAVSIPPAAILASQLLLGVPFGFLGLLLATPLTVSAIVAIQGFYLEDVLGEDVQLLGEPDDGESPPEDHPIADVSKADGAAHA